MVQQDADRTGQLDDFRATSGSNGSVARVALSRETAYAVCGTAFDSIVRNNCRTSRPSVEIVSSHFVRRLAVARSPCVTRIERPRIASCACGVVTSARRPRGSGVRAARSGRGCSSQGQESPL